MVSEDAVGRFRNRLLGEAHFDLFSRGRYANDASIYQIIPTGLVTPMAATDIAACLDFAREQGLPLTMRGGGTSQCGQTINSGLIVDCSKYLNKLLEIDVEGRRALVDPGIVLDDLNRLLKPHGLWFPVDISTASRATIGGMVGNNSCGSRSLRYGMTRHHVESVAGLLADGSSFEFRAGRASGAPADLVRSLDRIGAREADEIEARFPKVQRRVGGYNLDAIVPGQVPVNLAHLLTGSEGTLAVSTAVEIRLSALPMAGKALGICHFPTFRAAMEAAGPLVELRPTSVELVDRTMIDLAKSMPVFVPTLEAFLRGNPAAVLIVEFADTPEENARSIAKLHDVMSDLGFGFGKGAPTEGGVVEIWDAALASKIGELRKAGLNIMMSMKAQGKPVSFVEDCAVPLEHLADYTERLTELFHDHGTEGTWYAHASEGCLHVRPILNLRQERDVVAMRRIAEAAFEMIRDYKGSHSGEHGDGIVRSEFHEAMFSSRITRAFEEVKSLFDPENRLNPGRITAAPKMDDRSLMRYPPGYAFRDLETAHDWSAWSGAAGGFQGAVEMCNNNGACRKLEGGTMCPSYRVTRDERDVTRGRANALRLALTGKLGERALFSPEMAETMRLCVGCKACRRECPTGVDMAKMKSEVLHQRGIELGFGLRERMFAEVPRYARAAVFLRWGVRLRNRFAPLALAMERALGVAHDRPLPEFRGDWFRDSEATGYRSTPCAGEVVLLVDTLSRWIEPDIPRAAVSLLRRAGYHVIPARSPSRRPLCCGRTYLSAGMLDEARAEMERTLAALLPHVKAGRPIVGLEPSCLLTLRDEFTTLMPGADSKDLADGALPFEEFIARESKAGRLRLPMRAANRRVNVHGHCHQKAAGVMPALAEALGLVPDLEVRTIESGCCGMAGAFGYGRETVDVSRKMAELSLLPDIRGAGVDDFIVANGTSCRQQIADGTGRRSIHVAQLLNLHVSAAVQRSN
jgi:FAD/FMN-containing dehydrogenase/Fe-S oxidoreductase